MRLAESSHIVERPNADREAADVQTRPWDRDELVSEVPRRVTTGDGFRIATADDREIRSGMKAERGSRARPVHER